MTTDTPPEWESWLGALSPEVIDARFLARPDVEAEGTGQTLQYMELTASTEDRAGGRILDVGRYDSPNQVGKIIGTIEASLADRSISRADLPFLAAELARANDLPDDVWREPSAEDQQRFLAQNPLLSTPDHDVIPDTLISNPVFTDSLLLDAVGDPALVADVQADVATEMAVNALHSIGLSIDGDFNLARDTFYDAAHGERVITGIFQKDPADSDHNCRPMLVSLTMPNVGLGFSAQAMEFGSIGSLDDVHAEHDRVQTALETGGLSAGLTTIDSLDADRNGPTFHPLEIS